MRRLNMGNLKREKITLYQFLQIFPDESAADIADSGASQQETSTLSLSL